MLGNPITPLVDAIGLETLAAFQEAIAEMTGIPIVVCDHTGRPLLRTSGSSGALHILQSNPIGHKRLADLFEALCGGANGASLSFLCWGTAPIGDEELRVGTIVTGPSLSCEPSDAQLRCVADEFSLSETQLAELRLALRPVPPTDLQRATRFIQLLADVLGRLLVRVHNLQHREFELSAVHKLSHLLSRTQGLQVILDTIARQVCETMQVKAASIRLLNEQTNELVIKAVHNLSSRYLGKGPVMLNENPIDRAAFAGEAVYVKDAGTDPRIRFPEHAQAEGIVSGLSVGMTYRGQTVGVMRAYTDHEHLFSAAESSLLRSIASQAAAAVINSRLYVEALEAERYQRQLAYAGDIQRRMIPQHPPVHPHIEFATAYQPSFEVGGDFFDFYVFRDSHEVGLSIADVVGKGIPAALLMASLRTAFRLYAYSVAEVTEIMTMINIHMTRETTTSEFATMFYGVFGEDGRTLTYSCAGHDPPLHCRKGHIRKLSTNDSVIGVNAGESYHKKSLALRKGDVLLFYTDGAADASNFGGKSFGRERLEDSLRRHAAAPASQIVHNIIWDIRRFVGLADQTDDITMVVAKIV